VVFFTWAGCDEMDEVTGDGSAELLDDGSIEITFAYHNGDEAILKAKRDTSSTACQLPLQNSKSDREPQNRGGQNDLGEADRHQFLLPPVPADMGGAALSNQLG
jgi:hypothetical protein